MSLSTIVKAEEKELRDTGWDGVSLIFHGMVLCSREADWLNVALLWGRHDHHNHHGHHDGNRDGAGAVAFHVAQLLDGDTEYSLALSDISLDGSAHEQPRIECRHPSSSDYRQVLPDLRQVARGARMHAPKPNEHGPFQSVLRIRNAWIIVSGPMDPEFNDKVFEFRPPAATGAQRTFVTDLVKVRVRKPQAAGLPEGIRLASGRAFAIHNDYNGEKNPLTPENPSLEHSALYQAALNPKPSPPHYLTWVDNVSSVEPEADTSTVRRMFNWTDPICELERFGDL